MHTQTVNLQDRSQDLQQWGISQDQIHQVINTQPQQDFYVYEDNWLAFSVFWLIKHQWHIVQNGAGLYYQGLRYSALDTVLKLKKIPNKEAVFDDILIIEQAAKSALNQQ